MPSSARYQALSHGPITFAPLGEGPLCERQIGWVNRFASDLFGPVPPPPDSVRVTTEALAAATRLVISVSCGDRSFTTDAALWVPSNQRRPPVIVALTFTGPLGILCDESFPIDPDARIAAPDGLGRACVLSENQRGIHAYRWPIEQLTQAGFAVLTSCYGSWAPDDPDHIQKYGLKPLLGQTGALSLWAWALMRLVDVAEEILTPTEIIAAGHSRLGKAALWAAANDERIETVFANNAGAAGNAPSCHPVGETLQQLSTRFPHWVRPHCSNIPLDQHHLMACIAPRRLYVASAEEDAWADPVGTYLALKEAGTVWPDAPDWPSAEDMWSTARCLHHPALGHHLRSGHHDLTQADWELLLPWLTRSE